MLLAAVGCGDDSPTGPSGTSPSVTSITPNTGSTFGGTAVTISGASFRAPASVSIGGVAATSVTVVDATTISAVTGQRANGVADVVVTIAGRSGTLARGYTYVAPDLAPNTPPRITALTARGSRDNEPARFADLAEEIAVTANVQDSETPVQALTYEWAAPSGTFAGTGVSVKWTAPPSFPTPGAVPLTLTVREQYTATDSSGLPVQREHVVQQSVTVHVHDSINEIAAMARDFLVDFSEQRLVPTQVVRNFSDTCRGKASELSDVTDNQANYAITSWEVGTHEVTVRFGGVCPFRLRAGDACVQVPVNWYSTCINETRPSDGSQACEIGHNYRAFGTDQVAAIYASNRWWLCDSDFDGTSIDLGTLRIRAGSLFKK